MNQPGGRKERKKKHPAENTPSKYKPQPIFSIIINVFIAKIMTFWQREKKWHE